MDAISDNKPKKPAEPLIVSDDDLLPLSQPERLGLPFQRRVLGRRLADGSFPTPVRINGRLYITRRALADYKARLVRAEE